MPLFWASSGPTGTAAWKEGPHSICVNVSEFSLGSGMWRWMEVDTELGQGLFEGGGESLVAGGSVCFSICVNVQA